MTRGKDVPTAELFGMLGTISGLFFRMMFFGIRPDARLVDDGASANGQN